jgi:hypothetical protein
MYRASGPWAALTPEQQPGPPRDRAPLLVAWVAYVSLSVPLRTRQVPLTR